jgi:lysophospholipase L1-like esterase
MRIFLALTLALIMSLSQAIAQPGQKWVTTWVGSVQGPYPTGNPSAQPNMSVVFPDPKAGARDQSFRLIVKPDVWGSKTRIRLSNALGTQAVTFADVYVGLQLGSAELVSGSNQQVKFGGKSSVTVAPGESVWSDGVALPFFSTSQALDGRKLAVSFYVPQASGPMTWHAKALQTSYVTPPGAGSVSKNETEKDFPYSTASWYFLDAVDMQLPADTRVVMGFGDSITDGTASTMNGDDRWPDVLSRRLHKAYGLKIVVLNAGIGGNQVAGPAEYTPAKPFPGGQASAMRLERDIISLSGVNAVIWLEGINDFSKNGNASSDVVIKAMSAGVERLKAAGINTIGATVGSALASTSAAHGFAEQDAKRQQLNTFIRRSPLFVGVIEFDPVTLDLKTGEMKPEFVPESTTGGPGDKLHPNRAGYQAMANTIDLPLILSATQKTK